MSGKFWRGVGSVAGVVGAPFTGGASLPLTALSTGANVVAGIQESRQASKASNTLQEGGREAIGLLGGVHDQQRADLAPYMAAGQQGVAQMSQMANLKPSDLNAMAFMDPGLQFRLDEAQRMVENSAAARGNLLSGGTAKDLTKYAQGAASQEYANAFDRAFATSNEAFRRGSDLAQTGLSATGQAVGAAGAYGANAAGLTTDVASASAAGSVAQGNIWSDVIGGVANTIGGVAAARKDQSSYAPAAPGGVGKMMPAEDTSGLWA